ncbi:MAG: isoleucine--tRNA ligase [Candidatus Levybacteria bacterium RIFCSPLOWO2_01_FULL_36_13]|nr:MAG: isoleucine--tRNA ligase [Candidatus Levybacteria bacterium RIFCSPHIGHO2_01_FULL_36_15b]OGH35598.1 MAG: isoleucine--tRNA ligase [Candidatus Levybacteria bacterium RIFCSPLOWO2_01_FULL_36_13]
MSKINSEDSKKFKSVNPQIDFSSLEREWLIKWEAKKVIEKYLKKNNLSKEKFSFLDGPITANNPMGVHHAWGRTYKDFWQRYWNMNGKKQRFQNGFDEQGLWVEVEVEKELGLKSKKDIENLVAGDKFKSLEKFINLCKARVAKFSKIQTEQSKRLGYFMDWENSYHTSSDENNYAIWNFLKVVNEKGWLYKGHDSVPWCPRCGTAISQMEILTEEYKEIAHDTIFFKLPIIDMDNTYFLVWTTTPWTVLANVAIGINTKYDYGIWKDRVSGEKLIFLHLGEERKPPTRIRQKDNAVVSLEQWIMDESQRNIEYIEGISTTEILKLKYQAPFDDFSLVRKAREENVTVFHSVIDASEVVVDSEGTGLLHVATGAGGEDFKLGKKYNLPVIAPIEEDATYVKGLSEFSGKNAKKNPEIIIDYLKQSKPKFLFKVQKIIHRYPTCWRCKTELVWRVVDEWYIAMDKKDNTKKTYREQMIDVAKKITWLPDWGLDRELDWLKNMHDWLISKKRYWGLALPIWECKKCGNFDVIAGKEELKDKAVEGYEKFEGKSPHRPWVDQVKIKCSKCGKVISRIPDVGNPWLDAGIVPFSTMPSEWFPANFITESFPGQFKNWFYSLIAMSTALNNTNPFKDILGFASVTDEHGEEMHKSKGNMIEFNEAADKIGVDVMRWMYLRQNPELNLSFGYHVADEIRRLFHLRLWNVYSFFVTYANLNNFKPPRKYSLSSDNVLDKWIISRLNESIKNVKTFIELYQVDRAVEDIENFVINDLSNWYVRRSRDRVAVYSDNEKDKKTCLLVLWYVLTEYTKLLGAFIPFLSEEMYVNLTNSESVHLEDFPKYDDKLIDISLQNKMVNGKKVAELIHSLRKEREVKVRIPIRKAKYNGPESISDDVLGVVKGETNIYDLKFDKKIQDYTVEAQTNDENLDLNFGLARDIVRKIQEQRKKLETKPDQKVNITLPFWPKEYEGFIKKRAQVKELKEGKEFSISNE